MSQAGRGDGIGRSSRKRDVWESLWVQTDFFPKSMPGPRWVLTCCVHAGAYSNGCRACDVLASAHAQWDGCEVWAGDVESMGHDANE